MEKQTYDSSTSFAVSSCIQDVVVFLEEKHEKNVCSHHTQKLDYTQRHSPAKHRVALTLVCFAGLRCTVLETSLTKFRVSGDLNL